MGSRYPKRYLGSTEEKRQQIAEALADVSTDEEFVNLNKDNKKLDEFFEDQILDLDKELDKDYVPDTTPPSNNNDVDFIDPTPSPTSSENDMDVNLNSKAKRKCFRKRKAKISKMDTGFIQETSSGRAPENSDSSDFLFDLPDESSASKRTCKEIDNSVKNTKKISVAKGKKLKKRNTTAKKKTQKLVNPLVHRVNKSIEDLINTPSTSQTKKKTNNLTPNNLNTLIPETDLEDNFDPNQFKSQMVQDKNASDVQAHKSTANNLSINGPVNFENISQENQDQVEVISVDSAEKSQF